MAKESMVGVLKHTYAEWSAHNAMRLAAAMALYVMMALAPMLVVALTVLTLTGKSDPQKHQQVIHDQAERLVGTDGANAIVQILAKGLDQKKGGIIASVIGFIVALVSASGLFASLQDAINTIWDVKPKPNAGWKAMVRSRLVSIGVLGLSGLILVASLVASAVIAAVSKMLPHWLAWLSVIGDILVSVGVITALFAMIYKFLPDVKLAWKDVWLGGAITAVLFVAGKYGLAFYLSKAAVASPYGTAGSLAALLIFVYYSMAIVFFGAEFTRVYTESTGKEIKPDAFAVKLKTEDRAKRGEPHEDELEEAEAEQDGGRGGAVGQFAKERRRSAVRPAMAGLYPAAATGAVHRVMPGTGNGQSNTSRYVAAGAGVAVGALVAGLGALTLTSDERKMRARADELRLRDRLMEAERRMKRAARSHDLLERMSYGERVNRVEAHLQDIARQAKHIDRAAARVEQHGRPAPSIIERVAKAVTRAW